MAKHNVTVYSTPTCVYCKLVKQYFAENKVEFKEVDVSSDEKAAEDMIEKSGQMGVPVVDIDGQIIVGFDKPKIKAALGLSA